VPWAVGVTPASSILKVSVGIVVDAEDRILISKRPLHKAKGGYWEFPGGKIEANETPEAALIRELKEETGIEVLRYSKLMNLYHEYPEYHVALEIFVVSDFLGSAESLEGQELVWINKNAFGDYQFLEANDKIIRRFLG
jgi:8-oxo-dGTP diphosphatase